MNVPNPTHFQKQVGWGTWLQDDALVCMALISMTSMAEEVWCREWGNQFSSAPNKVSLMIWHKYSDRGGYIGSLLTPFPSLWCCALFHNFLWRVLSLGGFRQIGHRIFRGLAFFGDGKNVSISFLLTFTIYWSQLALFRYFVATCLMIWHNYCWGGGKSSDISKYPLGPTGPHAFL